MGHERGDLDDDWGYGTGENTETESPGTTEVEEKIDLSSLVLNPANLHSLCLEVFRKRAGSHDTLVTAEIFGEGLNDIMVRIHVDPLEDDEVSELWFGATNFAEFYLLVRELIVSMHRAVTTEMNVDDVLVDAMNQIKM